VPAPQRAALRVVPARTQARRRRRTILSCCAAVVTLLTVVAFHALLAQSQIELDRLEQRTAAAEQRYEEARLEHSLASSPERITARALELGMAPPSRPPIVVPVAGDDVPAPPDATSGTLNGWTDVKPTLSPNP
jgi:cell division protein FtsL